MTEQPGKAEIDAPNVGLHLDDERAIAAVARSAGPGPSPHRAVVHSTVLEIHPDNTVSLGGVPTEQSEAYTHFLDARADGVGVTGSKGTVRPAEMLVSMALLCLLSDVASSLDLPPGDLAVAATYPSRWAPERVLALRSVMNGHGLTHVALVTETEARDAWNTSMRANMASADASMAAAQGAALLAAQSPVAAVTRRRGAADPAPRRAPRRRPLFATAAFAAASTVGAVLAVWEFGATAQTAVPAVDNAQLAPSSTSEGPAPHGVIEFPAAELPAAEFSSAVFPSAVSPGVEFSTVDAEWGVGVVAEWPEHSTTPLGTAPAHDGAVPTPGIDTIGHGPSQQDGPSAVAPPKGGQVSVPPVPVIPSAPGPGPVTEERMGGAVDGPDPVDGRIAFGRGTMGRATSDTVAPDHLPAEASGANR